jgi:hypothetical protein
VSELYKVSEKIVLRDDVLEFAKDMSLVMNIKDAEEKPTSSFIEAMAGIELQMSRMREQIQISGVSSNFPEIYKRLIHVANFAMLAYNKVKTQ